MKSRNEKHLKAKELYFHGLVTALVAWILIGDWKNWWLILILFVSHTLIDAWKSYREQNTIFSLIDRFLHILTLVILAKFVKPIGVFSLIVEEFNKQENIVFIIGWILAIFPTGYYISLLTKKWQSEK